MNQYAKIIKQIGKMKAEYEEEIRKLEDRIDVANSRLSERGLKEV